MRCRIWRAGGRVAGGDRGGLNQVVVDALAAGHNVLLTGGAVDSSGLDVWGTSLGQVSPVATKRVSWVCVSGVCGEMWSEPRRALAEFRVDLSERDFYVLANLLFSCLGVTITFVRTLPTMRCVMHGGRQPFNRLIFMSRVRSNLCFKHFFTARGRGTDRLWGYEYDYSKRKSGCT